MGLFQRGAHFPLFPALLACGSLLAPAQGSTCLNLVHPTCPPAMCEMIKIMQEYGEVTCCLGSSANLRNSCLFLQSDIRSGQDPRAGGPASASQTWDRPAWDLGYIPGG